MLSTLGIIGSIPGELFCSTSGFVTNVVTLLKFIYKPHFVDTSEFTAKIKLLPVWKSKRPLHWPFSSGA